MPETHALIQSAYRAFNERNIDAALALMSDNVSWPKASEGGRVVGKNEIRGYWIRQWSQFDPYVEPLEITELADGRLDVRVRQLVKDLAGTTLSDGEVRHLFTVTDGRIERMDLGESGDGSETENDGRSAAFSTH